LSARQVHAEASADQKNNVEKYTRYERARIIGARALQISMGAPVLIKDLNTVEPIEVALIELERDLIPITVKKINKSAKREVNPS
jgi:DNA-directed RNA polymerase subunit K